MKSPVLSETHPTQLPAVQFSRRLREAAERGLNIDRELEKVRTHFLKEPGLLPAERDLREQVEIEQAHLFLRSYYEYLALPLRSEMPRTLLSALTGSSDYNGTAHALEQCALRYPASVPASEPLIRIALWVHELSHLAVAAHRLTVSEDVTPRLQHLTRPTLEVVAHGWQLIDPRRSLMRGRAFEEYVACANEEAFFLRENGSPRTVYEELRCAGKPPRAPEISLAYLSVTDPLLLLFREMRPEDAALRAEDAQFSTTCMRREVMLGAITHRNVYGQLVAALDRLACEIFPSASPAGAISRFRQMARAAHATGERGEFLALLKERLGGEGVQFLTSLGSIQSGQLFDNSISMMLLWNYVNAAQLGRIELSRVRSAICKAAKAWEKELLDERAAGPSSATIRETVQLMCEDLALGNSRGAVAKFQEANLRPEQLTKVDLYRLTHAIEKYYGEGSQLQLDLLLHHRVISQRIEASPTPLKPPFLEPAI